MMNLRVLLKRLILASIVLIFATAIFDAGFFDSLPLELQNYKNRLDKDEQENLILMLIAIPVLLIYILSLILLWKLKRLGRTLFTGFWIVNLIAVAGMMPAVYHPLAELCATTYTLINGLIFGLIYFSDLRFDFGKKPAEEI